MGIYTKLIFNTAKVTKAIDDAAIKRMDEATQAVRTQAMLTLSGDRTGRTYKVPGQNRTYVASSPGEPPAQRLGELRQNIGTLVESSFGNVTGKVGTDKIQGRILEFNSLHTAARPWLKPSFEAATDEVKSILKKRWFR